MSPTLLFALLVCYPFGGCYGAIDSGVTVVGITVGPNYQRAEGIRKLWNLIPNRFTINWNEILKHAYLVPRHTRTHARRAQSVPQKNAAMACCWIFTAHAAQMAPFPATETQRLSAGQIRLLLTHSCLAHQNVNVQVVNAPCPISCQQSFTNSFVGVTWSAWGPWTWGQDHQCSWGGDGNQTRTRSYTGAQPQPQCDSSTDTRICT